jgi:hypothetical protein
MPGDGHRNLARWGLPEYARLTGFQVRGTGCRSHL